MKARTIAILHQKGGVGKTTLALNLAAEAQSRGLRALVVDTDPQRTTAEWRNLRNEDGTLPNLPIIETSSKLLHRELPQLTEGYDRVFIDTSAGLNERSNSAVKAADLVLVPSSPSAPDLWSCVGLFRYVHDHAIDTPKPCVVVYNLTQTNSRNLTLIRSTQEEIAESYGVNFMDAALVRRNAWSVVMWKGRTILEGTGKDHDPKAIADLKGVYDELDACFDALTAAETGACAQQ